MLFILESLKAGAGLAFIPSFIAQEDLAAGRLLRVLPRLHHTVGTLHFVHPATQHVPRKVTAFRDHLIEHLAAHPLGARVRG
jgi:DNA-binding transcriptional LysR family regulator